MGIAIKHPVPDRVKPSLLTYGRMSKITNDGLTRSGTAVANSHMATVGVKGLKHFSSQKIQNTNLDMSLMNDMCLLVTGLQRLARLHNATESALAVSAAQVCVGVGAV